MSNKLKTTPIFLDDPDEAAKGSHENRACEWLHAFAAGYKFCDAATKVSGFRTTAVDLLKGTGHCPRFVVAPRSWLALLPSAVMAEVSISNGSGRYARRNSRPHWFTFADLASHYFNIGLLVGLDVLREEVKDPELLAQAWTQWRLFRQWPATVTYDVLLNNSNARVGRSHWTWRNPTET